MSAVADVHVETEPDGTLVVSWEVAGEPMAVDVAVGPTPERVDHEHVVSVAAPQRSVRLTDVRRGRPFVSVSPRDGGSALIAADRRVAFRDVTNFRDLGGYPVRGGGRTRWGRVFRADALHGLTGEDLDAYHRLGIVAVYDLRRDVERSERPNPVPSEQLPFLSNGASETSEVLSTPLVTEQDGQQILRTIYVGMLDHAAEQIGALLAGLADESRLPAVFHCHAGKDRTGVAAALLLEALGVDRERVLDDYELTSRYRLRSHQHETFDRLVGYGMGPEAAAGVLAAPRWAMAEALDDLDDRFGGVEPYLLSRAGLGRSHLDALRRVLVEA